MEVEAGGETASLSDVSEDGLPPEDSGLPFHADPDVPESKEPVRVEGNAAESSAFHIIEQLFSEGKVTGQRMAHLKDTYAKLHALVKRKQESETQLLGEAKVLSEELSVGSEKLAHVNDSDKGDASEAGQLRNMLLKHFNALALSEERQEKLVFETQALQEEKQVLQKEIDRTPDPAELKARERELQRRNEELQKEIAQHQQETVILCDDLKVLNEQTQVAKHEVEREFFRLVDIKDELVKTRAEPMELQRQIESITNALTEVQAQTKEYEQSLADLRGEKARAADELKRITAQQQEQEKLLAGQQDHYQTSQFEVDRLAHEFEILEERKTTLLGERASADMSIDHMAQRHRSLFEQHSVRQREKDREAREVKRRELQKVSVERACAHLTNIKSTLEVELQEKRQQIEEYEKTYQQLWSDRQTVGRAVDTQNDWTAEQKAELTSLAHDIKEMQKEKRRMKDHCLALNRDIIDSMKKRDEEVRTREERQTKLNQLSGISKTLANEIRDQKKRARDMQQELEDLRQVYDILKGERNKTQHLIQSCSQRASEMLEKQKHLENEVELLRTQVGVKDRLLAKSRVKAAGNIVARDTLKQEVVTERDRLRQHRGVIEQQKLAISHLTDAINTSEEEMVQLRKRYEQGVQSRNDRGIRLVSLAEEICIFYEKEHLYKSLLSNGEVELQAKDEEIKFLQVELADLQSSIEVLRHMQPKKKALDNELVTAQIQLSQCQDRIRYLERELENVKNDRVNYLGGTDPEPEEIQAKIAELESHLADKQQQLLEKDLLLSEVTRLTERAQQKVESSHAARVAGSRTVNELHYELKKCNRKTMAVVSELTMQQAEAIRLRELVAERQQRLDKAIQQLDRGLAPDEETEMQWLRECKVREWQQRDARERERVMQLEEQQTLQNGEITTAERRPNSYIPKTSDALPITKPYGQFGLFKSSHRFANERHFRKPVQRPMEI